MAKEGALGGPDGIRTRDVIIRIAKDDIVKITCLCYKVPYGLLVVTTKTLQALWNHTPQDLSELDAYSWKVSDMGLTLIT